MSLRTFTLFDQLSLFGDDTPNKPEIVIENIQDGNLVKEDNTNPLPSNETSLFNNMENEIAILEVDATDIILQKPESEVILSSIAKGEINEDSLIIQSQTPATIVDPIEIIDLVSTTSLLKNNSESIPPAKNVDDQINVVKIKSTIKKEKSKVAPKAKKSKPETVNNSNQIITSEWKGDKQYYSIGEVAELFKVNTSHIRFWTNEFKLKVRTTGKGDRLYTNKQIQELRTIHHLVKEKGFTLAGAKSKLKEISKKGEQTFNLKEALIDMKSKLIDLRKQLN